MARPKKSMSYLDRITQLVKDREYHAAAMDTASTALREIDGVLTKIQAAIGGATKKLGTATKTTGKRAKRQTFSLSGEESILAFVKSKGSPTSQQIGKHWSSQGRKGSAANALVKLTKTKKLKRAAVKEGRGSTYSIG